MFLNYKFHTVLSYHPNRLKFCVCVKLYKIKMWVSVFKFNITTLSTNFDMPKLTHKYFFANENFKSGRNHFASFVCGAITPDMVGAPEKILVDLKLFQLMLVINLTLFVL